MWELAKSYLKFVLPHFTEPNPTRWSLRACCWCSEITEEMIFILGCPLWEKVVLLQLSLCSALIHFKNRLKAQRKLAMQSTLVHHMDIIEKKSKK